MGLSGPSGLVNVEEGGRLRREEVETGPGSDPWQAGLQARSWAGRGDLELVSTSSPVFFQTKGCELTWDEAWS